VAIRASDSPAGVTGHRDAGVIGVLNVDCFIADHALLRRQGKLPGDFDAIGT